MKKTKKLFVSCILGLMLLSMVGCNKDEKKEEKVATDSKTIDLNKYVSVEFSGYNTMGEAEATFDSDAFAKDYKDKIKVKVKDGKGSDMEMNMELNLGSEPYNVLRIYCAKFDADKTSELSNGDVVKIVWDCDDEKAKEYFGYKLKYSDIEYKVEGLKELESFDPFEHVKVEITGIAPDGSVTITPDLDVKEMQYINFSVDKQYGLSNDDVVVVTASVDNMDEFANKFNSVPNPVSKELL